MLEYSEEFKQKCISVLGSHELILENLATGSEQIGQDLNVLGSYRFSAENIIEAVESNDIESLYSAAQKISNAAKLYEEWKELTDYQSASEKKSKHLKFMSSKK